MADFDRKYTVNKKEDYPPYFDFSTRTEERPDGTTVRIEYTELVGGEILETEIITDQILEPIVLPPQSIKTSRKNSRSEKKKRKKKKARLVLVASAVTISMLLIFCAVTVLINKNSSKPETELSLKSPDSENVTKPPAPDEINSDEEAVIMSETDEVADDFNPHPVESTKPSNFVQAAAINVDGITLDDKPYESPDKISFGSGKDYFTAEGVVTFRGDNYRSDPTYGCASISAHTLNATWSVSTGSLSHGNAVWTGSGWTGQPLIRKWTRKQKQHMNMYDWAKEDDSLVEVIYACMDGNIYFIDLKTGKLTRDTLSLGFTFKGSGALDPRGYPILYLGAGYEGADGSARVFVVNLFDCSVMYTFGNDDPFSLRGSLSYFDSSALVDAETDTLIYPGENGVIYLIKLGTKYNEETGSLSIDPERIVKWHCTSIRTRLDAFWPGMEDSAVIYKGYLYIMDNGGNFYCLNLNTLELVWVQDCLDDSNGSPVLSVEDGRPYLYASTSFHLGWRSNDVATIPVWKIDAETGEIVWQVDYECRSMEDLSGGVQSTIAVGRESLSDYIYVTVSRTGGMFNGVLACIEKKSGKKVWEVESAYTWSSPVCVYNSNGEGSIIYCNSGGNMYLVDGLTGEVYDTVSLSENNIEASPAVYDSMVVVGGRACMIWGVEIN